MSSIPRNWRSAPIAKLPRVGAMATMPSRLASFADAFPAIVRQVDRLYVFLDGHTDVPAFIRLPNVFVMRAPPGRHLGPSGRFLAMRHEPGPAVLITFDDDIRYPDGHVERLVAALVAFEGRAMVGFHGTLFKPPYESFARDMSVCSFVDALDADVRVDLLGLGTAAMMLPAMALDPFVWPETDMDDIMVAIEAERRRLPRVALARKANTFQAMPHLQMRSLWREMMQDDARQTLQMKRLLALEARSPLGMPPRPWPLPN